MLAMNEKFIPDCYKKPILVLGCGNILFGDDGFGPAVIEYLGKNYQIPDDVCLLDVGTGAREILFTITLADKKPKKIIVIDALDCQNRPGEIFIGSVDNLPKKKIDDFSLHQLPTSNLLRELRELCKVEVILLATQPEYIPKKVKPGLSKTLQNAVPRAAEYIAKRYF